MASRYWHVWFTVCVVCGQIGTNFYPCSFTVLDQADLEFIFGLDMLRKHQVGFLNTNLHSCFNSLQQKTNGIGWWSLWSIQVHIPVAFFCSVLLIWRTMSYALVEGRLLFHSYKVTICITFAAAKCSGFSSLWDDWPHDSLPELRWKCYCIPRFFVCLCHTPHSLQESGIG
jgi:hypothetical protein